eukprot:jgi/Tetstr1/431639/TSEL_021169.t1
MARIWSAIAVEVGSVRAAPTPCDSAGVSDAPSLDCRAAAAALAAATALAIAWLAMCSASRGEARKLPMLLGWRRRLLEAGVDVDVDVDVDVAAVAGVAAKVSTSDSVGRLCRGY